MKGKLLDKLTAILLIFIMTFSYWGVLVGEVYAEYEELENQKVQTNNKNVEFDAYFKENDKSVHITSINKKNQGSLYINMAVNNGYLKQISIKVDNPNFSMQKENLKVDGDEINVTEVQDKEEIEVPFVFEKQELIDADYFSRETKITLSATYVDQNGKEKLIGAERKILVNWTEEVSADSEQAIEKIVDLGNGRFLLQTNLKVQVRDNSVPVQNTNIEILNPTIENTKIEDAKIYTVKTTMSNGIENTLGLSKENWQYNEEEGKIVVNIENTKTEDGKISWKDGEDEFKLIYIVNSQAQSIEGKDVKLQVTGNINYSKEVVPFENIVDGKIELSGRLVDISYLCSESINKGYMYAASNETEYRTKAIAEISYSEIVDYLDIEMSKDTFVLENGDKVNTNATIYKRTEISKANFDALFGEEGKIEIYGNGEKVAEINKETEANEAGNIEINYEKEVNSVKIVTSKPVAEGKLEVNNVKAVKAETGYGLEEIKAIKEIEAKAKVKTNITEEEKAGRVRLNETVSKAEITMQAENLSTVVKNENVEMRVLFRTDSNIYDLYKNPSIEIELPEQVKEVSLRSIEAAFGEGFSLNWYDIVENAEGKKVIRIALTGEQTKYAIDISEGMSLTIKADMMLDKKSGSSEEKVKLRYRNEKAIGYDNGGEAEGRVGIEAPTGVVAINSIDVEGRTSTSLSSKEQTEEIEILTDKKIATMTIDVINNYEEEIVNPSIIGRIPFEGNKKVNGEELGSTFTAAMVRGLEKTEGIEEGSYKIYYSSNAEATEEIGKEENGWKETVEEAGEVKSYLIEVENYKMEQGEVMTFTYDVEIPEGLNHNESSYGTYEVSYGIEEGEGIREEKIVAPTVGATTGAGPEIEVSLESNVENNAEVEEGQIIKYSVVVKNVGSVDAKNVKATATVPKNTTYVKFIPASNGYDVDEYIPNSSIKEFSDTINVLEAGKTEKIDFYAKVDSMLEHGKKVDENGNLIGKEEIDNSIVMKAKVIADDLGKELETNELSNTRVAATLTIKLESIFDEKTILSPNDTTNITAVIKNPSIIEDKHNVVVTYNIPQGYEYISAVFVTDGYENNNVNSINYDKKTRVLTIKVSELKNQNQFAFEVNLKISDITDKRIDYENIMKVKCDESLKEKSSNIIKHVAGIPILEARQTSNKEKYINIGEEIQYIITIKNLGIVSAKNVKIEDFLPEELDYIETKYQTKETSGGNSNTAYVGCTITIPANSEAIITIKAKGKQQDKEEVEIKNTIKLSGENIKEFYTNPLTHILLNTRKVTDSEGNVINVYTVSGTAWKDANKDGRKDSGEAKISNIGVILIDGKTGSIATNASSNEEQRTTTDANGEYRFNEVKAGEYIVVFLYDTNKYTLTEYKKEGVLESENSDAVKSQIKFEGENKIAGVTETIKIKDLGASGINIGLIEMDSAVFSIDKVVAKITMKNPKTSKTVEYKDSKLAKMDVDGKYMTSTNLVMEYKIRVTNEGSVEGYVKKIVDKVPSQFKFSTDLNKDWYLCSNGEVYNTSLANTIIKPGETKEVTLVLTKKMTESGNGIVHNTAEISEVYNEYGAENIINNDITRSSADVVIGIKTGKEVTYIVIGISIIAILGLGIYFINKKVLKKENR